MLPDHQQHVAGEQPPWIQWIGLKSAVVFFREKPFISFHSLSERNDFPAVAQEREIAEWLVTLLGAGRFQQSLFLKLWAQ